MGIWRWHTGQIVQAVAEGLEHALFPAEAATGVLKHRRKIQLVPFGGIGRAIIVIGLESMPRLKLNFQ